MLKNTKKYNLILFRDQINMKNGFSIELKAVTFTGEDKLKLRIQVKFLKSTSKSITVKLITTSH